MSDANKGSQPKEEVKAEPAEELSASASWQRLSPVAILYFIASNIKKWLSFLIYAIPALAVSASSWNIQNSPYFIPVIVVALSSVVGSGLISYFFYHFRVRHDHVEIRSGVLHRRHLNLPFWRIQNVKIEQPLYYRATNYAVLELDTAGSSGQEARIVALPLKYASALRQQILSLRRQHLAEAESDAAEPSVPQEERMSTAEEDVVINRRSIKDLVLHGITNNRVWIILGAMAPFYDEASAWVVDWLDRHELSLAHLAPEQTLAWWQFGLYAFTFLLIIMLLLALLSVAASVVTFYGYTLSRSADRYIRRSGLLNKQEVSMRVSRLQLVALKQDWLDRVLKRVNLYFEQNASGASANQDIMAVNKLLVPSVTVKEAHALVLDALPESRLDRAAFIPISKRFLWQVIGLKLMPLYLGLSALAFSQANYQLVALLSALLLVASLFAFLRWKRWGIAWDLKFVYVRSGMIGMDYRCFEVFKLQQVRVRQTILMKRKKVATVQFTLASGSVSIPFMDEQHAYALVNHGLYHAEKSRLSWM